MNSLFLMMWAFALSAAIVGPRFGHRRWTSFLIGACLGPIGVVLVTTRLTLQPVTPNGTVRILSAKVIQPKRPPPWPTVKGSEELYSYSGFEDGH
jgi:hypothetical protein